MELKPPSSAIPDAIARLIVLGAIAIPIERFTQVFLLIFRLNGDERSEALRESRVKQNDATVSGHAFAFLIGIAVAISGVSFLDAILTESQREALDSDPEVWKERLFYTADVLVTAGILTGGASGIHQLIEELKLLMNVGTVARRDVSVGSQIAFALQRNDGSGRLTAGAFVADANVPDAARLPAGSYDRCIVQKVTVESGSNTETWSVVLPLALGGAPRVRLGVLQSGEDAAGVIAVAQEDLDKIAKNEGFVPGRFVQMLVVE